MLAVLVSVFGWVHLAAPTHAATPPAPTVVVYGYDAHGAQAPASCNITERGPPQLCQIDSTYDAFDHWSRGASARSDRPKAPATYAYDDGACLVGTACGSRSGPRQRGASASGRIVIQRSRVAAKYGDDVIEGIGDARSYVNLTKGGSIRNVGTNTTHTEFAETLTSGGWISRTSKDGAVQIFQRDGAKYVLRSKNSSGYAGWNADFTPAGSTRHTLEIRLGYVP